jgi:hypothetical protein
MNEMYERAERGRLALLAGLDAIEWAIDSHALLVTLGRDVPPLGEYLRKVTSKVHEEHRKAWA